MDEMIYASTDGRRWFWVGIVVREQKQGHLPLMRSLVDLPAKDRSARAGHR
jgi:hypothetical protein